MNAASLIRGASYKTADELADVLASVLGAGLRLRDLNTADVDNRYPRLDSENTFTAAQRITTGPLVVSGAPATGNGVRITHGGTGTGNDRCGLAVSSSGEASALYVNRDVASPTDYMAHFVEPQGNLAGVRITYEGTAAGLSVAHTGGSGYGIEVTARGINVTGASQTAGLLTVSSGGIIISAGGLAVNAGGASITGGLSVLSSGASITGNLAVTGAISSGGTSVVLVSSTYSLQYKDHAGTNQTKTIYAP